MQEFWGFAKDFMEVFIFFGGTMGILEISRIKRKWNFGKSEDPSLVQSAPLENKHFRPNITNQKNIQTKRNMRTIFNGTKRKHERKLL